MKQYTDSKPWFGKQCGDAVREKNKSFKKWHSSRLECDRIALTKSRSSCKKIISEAKKIVRWLTASCPNGKRAFYSLYKTINRNFAYFRLFTIEFTIFKFPFVWIEKHLDELPLFQFKVYLPCLFIHRSVSVLSVFLQWFIFPHISAVSIQSLKSIHHLWPPMF